MRTYLSATLSRFIWAVCAGLALVHARADEAPGELQDCVQTVEPRSGKAAAGTPLIGAAEDIGNVSVMEVSGDYRKGFNEPRRQAATRFYQTHEDRYDFLVVFTTFEFDTGAALAFHNLVRNDTAGLGQPMLDLGADFGSPSRLQGYIDMAAMSRYSFNSIAPDYHKSVDTLAHELMHRWGVAVHFIDASGQDSADLIGQQASHWSYFVDTDASVMYGSDWQAQADGSFRSVDIRHRYSPLDLYLAGFASREEVPPFTLIRNANAGAATDLPELGASIHGVAETITIDQIIAASGARVPSAANSQRDFNAALILLKRPGENVAAERLLQLERFRVRFQQQLAEMTDGRAAIHIYTQAHGAAAAPPTILHGSGSTAAPGGVPAAIVWLESQQAADGHWQDRPATALRDTVAVVRALEELDPAYPGLALARAWLADHPVANVDQRSWRLIGAQGDSDASALAAAQDSHGGFALEPGWNASSVDTALVAAALTDHGRDAPGLNAALQALGSQQNVDGSFGVAPGGRGHLLPTLRVASLLARQSDSDSTQRLAQVSGWVQTRQAADGGVGTPLQSALASTVDTYALFGRLTLASELTIGVRNFVRQQQQVSGDWGGSTYLTATAMLAYAHDQRPNLMLATAPTIAPVPLQDGERATLSAVVANSGNVPIAATALRWYDGDPDLGGVQIGGDVVVPDLAAGSSANVKQYWDTTGLAGTHELSLVLDAAGAVMEASEIDNRGRLSATVLPPSTQPDLALTSADFGLVPASVSTLPSAIHVTGTLRNIGAQGASGAVLRLYAQPDLSHALAEASVDVPARGSIPIELAFTATQAATLNLLVRADPDGAIAEGSEANNDAELTLPFGESLDLETTNADLALLTTPALVGRSLDFEATVRNRGTVDSPPVTLHAEVVQDGVATPIFDGTIQVTAGQNSRRRFNWRPLQPGPAQLRVVLDPVNQVAETDEGNNVGVLDFTVDAPTQADLTFISESLVFLPTPALEGQPFTATLGVRNLSSVATGAFRVALYAADPHTGAVAIGSSTVASLAGSSQTSVSISVPDMPLRGDQRLFAQIDADDQIAEGDEGNNTVVQPLRVLALPDLAISVADVVLSPPLPAPGQSVQARVTVRNLGGQDAQGVKVRLLEGDVASGVPAGADIDAGTLPAGASMTLVWNWTLGLNANSRSVSAIVDPEDIVREGSADNNVASLPYDVQDSDFFTSERYISPNGDGVQDAAAIVFRMQQAGPVEVDVINGALYTVRHFSDIALNGDLRGQVLWDGRDDRGRIVPDGDYRIVAAGGDGHLSDVHVTVDNNHSSLLEAVGTPHGVYGELPTGLVDPRIPPASGALRDQIFGRWGLNGGPSGVYRTDTVYPGLIPVISIFWLDAYGTANNAGVLQAQAFAFSHDGSDLVAALRGTRDWEPGIWIAKTAVDQIDAPIILAEFDGVEDLPVLGFADATTVLAGPDRDGMLDAIDVTSHVVSPLRPLEQEFRSGGVNTIVPLGILHATSDSPVAFLPRDPAKPLIRLQPESVEAGEIYEAQVSPSGAAVAVYRRNSERETIELVDLARGTRSMLASLPSSIAHGELSGNVLSVGHLGMGWLSSRNQLLVMDAATQLLTIHSESGQRLSQRELPSMHRIGAYWLQDRQPPIPTDPASIFATTFAGLAGEPCTGSFGDAGVERRIFDPARNQLLLGLGEDVAHDVFNEGWNLVLDPGIRTYFSIDADDGGAEVIQQGTLLPLQSEADQMVYPLLEPCLGSPAASWPQLILRDGATIRTDGRIQSIDRGVLPESWPQQGAQIQQIWPDDARTLLSNGKMFTTLQNLHAVLHARTLGRGIELSGIAADRNFASYHIDWAPIENQSPSTWQALLPSTPDEVVMDEFMTWVPPQPGTFVIRLTVVDKAGNRTSVQATASSFDSSVIDNFSLAPRYFSPNGDGIKDVVVAKYRVRLPATLAIRITDASGAQVRSVDLTYGAADIGAQEFSWDGRNDNGQRVPDARYRLSIDGFAAWVTIDSVAPELGGDVPPAYVRQLPCDANDHGDHCPPRVEVRPQVRFASRDPNVVHLSLQSSPIGSGDWSEAYSREDTSMGRSGDPADPRYWLQLPLPASSYATRQFRLVATDAAGNTRGLAIGNAEDVLALERVSEDRGPDSGADSRPSFPYQAPPFDGAPDTHDWQAIPVDRDADGDYLAAANVVTGLVRVAVEIADPQSPQQWTERAMHVLEDVPCAPLGPCLHRVPGDLRIPLDVHDLPAGGLALVRLRGEHSDGRRFYSNQGYLRIGGIDQPVCTSVDHGYASVNALEYLDGVAHATLHYMQDDGVHTVEADRFADDQMFFRAPWIGGQPNAWVTATDAAGRTYRSKDVAMSCPQPPTYPDFRYIGAYVAPVIRDQCDGQPTGRIALGFDIVVPGPAAPKYPVPRHYRLSYTDGISGSPVVLAEGDNPDEVSQRYEVSTEGWPEGEYAAALDVEYPDGRHQSFPAPLPVTRQAPTIAIELPRTGERVCALPTGDEQQFPASIDLHSATQASYRLGIGAGPAPTRFACELAVGERYTLPQVIPCPSYSEIAGFSLQGLDGLTSRLAGHFESLNGVATLQMKGLGWSGGTVCEQRTFVLDSLVELAERQPPRTVVPILRADAPIVGISTHGDSTHAQGLFFLRADEPVSVEATLHRAHIVGEDRELQLDSESLATLVPRNAASGDINIAWDGNLNSQSAADGLYGIAIDGGDDCTHTRRIVYGALVDSTPPVVQLTSPAAGSTVVTAAVPIAGSVQDNVILTGWQLDFATAASPDNWQNIATGTSPVPMPEVLRNWSRGSLSGAVDIRLTATDAMGNRSEAHLPLLLAEPSVLIGGADVQPMLFSPNADGVLDAARVQLNLLHGATVDLRVLDAGGGLLSTLYVGPQPAGAAGYAWNGAGSQGQVVSDGPYKVRIQAQDAAAPAETVDLGVIVDSTPPLAEVRRPAGAFASSTSSVELHFDDLHFAGYEARLTRVSDGVPIATQSGTQAGDVVLATLAGVAEGRYALHVEARDGAGNKTVRDSEFEIDATAPVVALETPADGALIASASATSVVGSVDDAHLATWTLAVATENEDIWTDLKAGSASLPSGELLAWTPNLPDGRYRLRLRATDQAGSATEVVHVIDIDGTVPTALITAPADGSFIRGASNVDGTATDAHFAGYRLSVIVAAQVGGGQWSDIYAGTEPVDAGRLAAINLGLPENDYLLRLTVTDRVGLSSSSQVRVRIDSQPPPAPIGLSGQVGNHRDALLDWNAVVAGDLAGYVVYRGDERITSTAVATTHYVDQDAPEGNWPYRVRAVDQAGNESAPSNTVTLLIDHTPPTVQILRPHAGERVHGTYDIVGTAYSSDDFKRYTLAAQAIVPPHDAQVLANGTLALQGHTLAAWDTSTLEQDASVRLHLEAEDTHGNVAQTDVDVVIDNAPPAKPEGLVAILVGADAQVHWNANSDADLLGYLLYRDNGLVNATGPNLPADLRPFALTDVQYLDAHVPDGQHTYVVYAIDQAGNVSLASDPASLDPLDNTPPSMTIESPAEDARFESSITVLATSRDTDIAQVQFAYRAQGVSSWTDFGPVLTSAPYRVTWTPASDIAYGTYEIRALARDAGGRYDPAPPSVRVVRVDLTPPDAPTNLHAHADGDTVHLTWNASSAADVTGYLLARNGSSLATLAATAVTCDDVPPGDGHYGYTVSAIDGAGHASPSNVADANVFSVSMQQPFTPSAQASVDLFGHSARAGSIALHVETESGAADASAGTTSADGAIALSAQALAMRSNHFTLRVTDAAGDISRPAEWWVDRGALPATPTSLAASIDDHLVTLGWDPNSEPDLLGYRVFRNGQPLSADHLLGELTVASSASGSNAAAAVDADPQSYWEAGVYDRSADSDTDPALELAWVEPRIVVGANLAWSSLGLADGRFDIEAWSGHAWVRVAQVRGTAQLTSTITFSQAYRTTRVRLILRSEGTDTGSYRTYQLTDVRLNERPLQSATSLAETVLDGSRHYQVTAVNAYAFESAPSDPVNAGIGDTQGPDAVVLSGELIGNSATLSWSASAASDVARYELQRDGQPTATIAAGAPLNYVDAGLMLGTYAYVVRAYDAFDNEGPPSNTVTLTVTGDGPGVPVGLVVTAPAQGAELDISWQPGSGAASVRYALRRATSAIGPFAVVADDLLVTTYRDLPLANGNTYFYTVEAFDAAGDASGQSAPASGTPRDHVAPGQPVLTYPTVAGEPIAMSSAATDVCGLAEAGTIVDLDRSGTAVGTFPARTGYEARTAQITNYGTPPLVAPSGTRIATVNYDGVIVVTDIDDAVAAFVSPPATRLATWAAHGEVLYYSLEGSDTLYRWELGRAPEPFIPPIAAITAFAPNTRGSAYAAAGTVVVGSTPTDGVWLFDAVGGAPRRIGDIASVTLSQQQPLRWSPDGTHLLVIESAAIHLVDTLTAQIQAVLPVTPAAAATWSPDGQRVAHALVSGTGSDELRVFDIAGSTDTTLQDGRDSVFALAWSPAGEGIAVLDAHGLDVVDPASAASLPLRVGYMGWTTLSWSASGRIAAGSSYELYLAYLPGWFCASQVPLSGGTNLFSARASDAAGNHGFGSAPIEVDVPTGELPDLAVTAADLFVVPPSGATVDDFALLVTLHNNGPAAVEQPELVATLVAPDGARMALDVPVLASLPGHSAMSVTVPIGALAAAGTYRIDVAADPAQRVREGREDNNAASTTLAVSADGAPLLDLNLASTVFAPGRSVTGEFAVSNTGSPFAGHVKLDVQDAAGAPVADLGDVALPTLGFGQHWSAPVSWATNGVFAGDYRLRARLYAAAGGAPISERVVAFTLQAVRHIQLNLAPDSPTQVVGNDVVAHSSLVFSDGNALLEGAVLRLGVFDAAGSEVWYSEQALGTLLPGYEIARDDRWATAAHAEGVYTLRLTLLSAAYTAMAEATVALTAATPTATLSGSLAFDPGTTLVAGQGVQLRARIVNPGSAAIAGVQARVRIVAEPGQIAAGESTDTFDLAAGATHEAATTLTAPPLALTAHAAILEAHLPADTPGQWRLLARQGFAVVDGLPPTIDLLAPRSDRMQPAVVPFSARIVDLHSGVAAAEISIDAGTWQPLSAGADGLYSRGLGGLIDGTHTLSVRARDGWGNQTQTAPLPFSVDATPPLIDIAGVADGDLLNHAVTPLVTISDAHLQASEIRLDNAVFASGTSVDGDGSHVLIARATDDAGNASVRSVRFRIDRTAPTATIVAPADGAVVAQASVDVDVLTEPAANVALVTGVYQSSAVADAQGHALFAGVPLVSGSNAIAVIAQDGVGNSSAPVTIHVAYEPVVIGPLTGSLQPPGAELAWGTPLGVHIDVHNPNAVALDAQHLRVRVLDPLLAPLAEQTLEHDFAAQADYAADLVFTSDGWPLGNLTLVLELQQASGWLALDTRSIALVDRTPPLLAITAPHEGDVLRAPIVLHATADDVLSGIASVEASIDGDDWSLLVPAAGGGYESAPLALADGDHRLDLRGHDGAGNLGGVASVHIAIDTAPPLINIAGVGDGDLLAHAVTPAISVFDPHLFSSDVRLNGQPFVSGTAITASGEYRIDVQASDSAGNEASTRVQFTLDLDAPTLTFTAPAPDTVVTTPSVDVSGQTEALATVHLVAAAFSVDIAADADGRFELAGVPLQEGSNTLLAHATDAAGNVGAQAQVNVIYQPPQVAITGRILGLSTWPQGSPVPASYSVHNTGAVALPALPLRFELRAATGGDVLLEDAFAIDLPIGAEADGTRDLAAASMPAGGYTLTLSANLPTAAGWSVLDSVPLTLLMSPCRHADLIFADGFDGIGVLRDDSIYCDGFDPATLALALARSGLEPWIEATAWLAEASPDATRQARVAAASPQPKPRMPQPRAVLASARFAPSPHHARMPHALPIAREARGVLFARVDAAAPTGAQEEMR